MKDNVDPRLLDQRIRNRILEYLGGVAEFPSNRGVWDIKDVINEWEMYVDDPFEAVNFPSPTYTSEEVSALASVHAAWSAFADAAVDTSNEKRCLSEPEWKRLVSACAHAEEVFSARGRLSEETLVQHDT